MPTNAWGRDYTRPSILNYLIVIASLLIPNILLAQTIVIGEINWAGSEASIADEWIELWNLGTESQSLNGWKIAGASKEPITLNESHTILPQQTFLIANYSEHETRSTLSVQPNLVTTEISLTNDRLHLALFNPEGILINEAGNGGKPVAGSTQPPSSMVREDLGIDEGKAEAWSTSTSTVNLDVSSLGYGTPGICDGCGSVSTSSRNIPTHSSSTDINPPFYATTSSTTPENTSSTYSFSTSSTWSASFTSSTLTDVTSTVAEWIQPASSTQTTTTLFLATTSSPDQASTDTETEATFATSTAASDHSSSATPEEASICKWYLSSIFPAPSNGPEWVELTGCSPERKNIEGWSIHDQNGHIITLTNETAFSILENDVIRLPLPGQHLRNTGDTVILRGPEGGIYDIIAYPSLKQDEHYQRRENRTWWIPERIIIETVGTAVVTPTVNIPPSPPSTAPPLVTNIQTAPPLVKPQKTVSIASPKTTSPVFSLSYEEYKTPTYPPEKKSAPKPSKTPSPRKGRKKNRTSMPKNQSPRVRVQGIVGTPPGLIGKQRFVLLNTEGRGLLIHANNKQPSPPLHALVEISGSIIRNDDGIYLSMHNDDRWNKKTGTAQPPEPQIINLGNTDPEKNWGLVELVGTVNASSRASAKIVVEDTDIDINIPRSLNYRAERLKKGDVIRIRGVIDINREIPKLYPRQATEITLLEHALHPATHSNTTNNTVPPWLPLGAASTTIAGGYGWKRLQKWREQKHLEEQLENAVKQLSQSS